MDLLFIKRSLAKLPNYQKEGKVDRLVSCFSDRFQYGCQESLIEPGARSPRGLIELIELNKSWKSWNEQEAEVGEELKALSTGCKESIWRKKNIE